MNEIQLIADLWEYSQRANKPLTIKKFKCKFRDLIRHKIKNHYQLTSETKVITGKPPEILRMLIDDMAGVLCYDAADVIRKNRRIDISYFRHLFVKISVDHSISTLSGIGEFMHRDHTTILHSYRTAVNLLESKDPIMHAMWVKYITNGDKIFTRIYEKQNIIQ